MKTKQSRPLAARSAFGRAGLKMATLLLSTGLLLAACGGGDDVLEAASEAVGEAISEEIEDRSDDAEPTDSAGGEGRPRPTEIEFGQTYEVDVNAVDSPMTPTIPPGSVTVLSLEGDPANALLPP